MIAVQGRLSSFFDWGLDMRLANLGTLLLCVAMGCSGRDPNLPEPVPVSGTITIDGQPATNTTISFIPTGATPGTGSGGATDGSGKYSLRTAHNGEGAPAGEYKVVISKLRNKDGSDFPLDSPVAPIDSDAAESLPPEYSDAEKTTLTATVPAGGGTIDFPLKSKP
jgi:hypothetical protein